MVKTEEAVLSFSPCLVAALIVWCGFAQCVASHDNQPRPPPPPGDGSHYAAWSAHAAMCPHSQATSPQSMAFPKLSPSQPRLLPLLLTPGCKYNMSLPYQVIAPCFHLCCGINPSHPSPIQPAGLEAPMAVVQTSAPLQCCIWKHEVRNTDSIYPQPRTHNPRPTTHNLRPTTRNPRPTTHNLHNHKFSALVFRNSERLCNKWKL